MENVTNTEATLSLDEIPVKKGDNKKCMLILGAVHIDLYDQTDIIPFDKMEEFFKENLK